MKLSTRARYGLRAVVDLAVHQGEGLVPLRDIALRQEISLAYLEQLISPLIAAGLVRSTRGTRGGVSLAKLPAEIRLSEVVRALEGSIAPVECINKPGLCHRSPDCVSRDVWKGMMEAMVQVLDSMTLQDLALRPKETEQAAMEMYYI
jgi:Rrf2 family transcriptional regulator, cysteine metabolism repressor